MLVADVFGSTRQAVEALGLTVVYEELDRPWGGFFYIDPTQTAKFIGLYFPDLELTAEQAAMPMQPKILMVAPGMRLSWQYHHRRSELWRVTEGPVGVITGDTDEPGELQELPSGGFIALGVGRRHRLVGLGGWGVVAEIWVHEDPGYPSDEADIVRVADDFAR